MLLSRVNNIVVNNKRHTFVPDVVLMRKYAKLSSCQYLTTSARLCQAGLVLSYRQTTTHVPKERHAMSTGTTCGVPVCY
jgi:hypothetical protein